jgi:transcriptional regulator with XRE-family HTH domain
MRGLRVPSARTKPPTVRLRRLSAELRRLRSAAGMSREHVEEQTGVNEGTLYRIETARARPQRRTLMALLDLYNAPEPLRGDLLELARGADDQGWLRQYQAALPGEYSAYISFEAEARSVRNYESLFIPGLLQTEDYARAVISGVLPMATEIEVDQRVQARLERQQLLAADEPLDLWAVMDEAAVRRLVGGRRVMEAQAAHLIDMTHQANITIQVIPYGAGAHPGMPGSFVYVEFKDPADSDLVYIDTMAGDLFLESETDLRRYGSMFDHLRAVALSPNETVSLLTSMPGKYRVTPVTSGSKGG